MHDPNDNVMSEHEAELMRQLMGEPELEAGTTGLLEVPPGLPEHIKPLTDEYFAAKHDSMVSESINWCIQQGSITVEQANTVWENRALMYTNSALLDAPMHSADLVIKHLLLVSAAKEVTQRSQERADKRLAKAARKDEWLAWIEACKARKARIALVEAAYELRKAEAEAATKAAREYIAQWDAYVKAGKDAVRDAQAEQAPSRPHGQVS